MYSLTFRVHVMLL